MDKSVLESIYIQEKYKPDLANLTRLLLPNVDERLLDMAIDNAILTKMKKPHEAKLYNNHKEIMVNSNTLEIADYILKKDPILTSYGVLFGRHGAVPNLIRKVLDAFLDNRDVFKKKRNKEPKGGKLYKYYDMLQLLAKLDANALYGVQGMKSSLLFNLHTAASITSMGQSIISASGLFFEMFLHNNVKYESLDELLGMINNVIKEKPNRKYKDSDILDRDISPTECFDKVIMTCGFDWIPNEREMNIVYKMIHELDQENINRLYYKNNLYDFMDNSKMTNLIKKIVQEMKEPMIFPTAPPENVKEDIDELCYYLHEYVYYEHQIVSRLDKYSKMIRSVSIITDTDSVIVSLDYWYKYVMELVKGLELPLAKMTDGVVTRTGTVKAEDALRYSIVNIMAYFLDKFINDYMTHYVNQANALEDDGKSKIIMKNEYLFKRVLVTDKKKNYASIIELQEGSVVPESNSLSITGLPIKKSTLNAISRDRLQDILKNKVLNIPEEEFSQVEVIKALSDFEKDIIESLRNGNTEYYKPVPVKPIYAYDNPLGIQGIKSAMVYNIIKDEYSPLINLEERNRLMVVKVDINKKNIGELESLMDKDKYEELVNLMSTDEFKSITSVGVPDDGKLPDWILSYIDYDTIVSDNIKNFPITEIGVRRGKSNNAYSNIVSF